MNVSGDAAEKVVRMSLEGTEYAIRIAGSGSIKTAMLLATILKQETKTKGKTRLTGMLKSGKELKVFTVQQKDLVLESLYLTSSGVVSPSSLMELLRSSIILSAVSTPISAIINSSVSSSSIIEDRKSVV